MKKEKITLSNFDDGVIKRLKNNPEELKEYEDFILEQYSLNRDIKVLLEGLKIVAKVKGNIAQLARNSKVKRHSIYSILSKDGNPRIVNFTNVLDNLGFDVIISRRETK